MLSYQNLVAEFSKNPRDIVTVPKNPTIGVWFHVFVQSGFVYIDNAKTKKPSSKISIPRRLNESEINDIYELYQLRKKGISVSEKAKQVTQNQVYWYGIFSEMRL